MCCPIPSSRFLLSIAPLLTASAFQNRFDLQEAAVLKSLTGLVPLIDGFTMPLARTESYTCPPPGQAQARRQSSCTRGWQCNCVRPCANPAQLAGEHRHTSLQASEATCLKQTHHNLKSGALFLYPSLHTLPVARSCCPDVRTQRHHSQAHKVSP